MKSEYIFKLNIATYLEYERLTQESYLSIDYSNVDSVKKLMYSCINANNEFPYTYNEFMKLKDKFILPYVNLFKIELKKLQQYNKEEVQESTEENTEPIFIREIVPILVKNCNLGIEYVLYSLPICDISMYVEYYNNQNKSKLEMDRLWTYYTMLPHINTKKIKSPKDLIKFNWEVDDKKSIENITEDDFDAMINSAPKFK